MNMIKNSDVMQKQSFAVLMLLPKSHGIFAGDCVGNFHGGWLLFLEI